MAEEYLELELVGGPLDGEVLAVTPEELDAEEAGAALPDPTGRTEDGRVRYGPDPDAGLLQWTFQGYTPAPSGEASGER